MGRNINEIDFTGSFTEMTGGSCVNCNGDEKDHPIRSQVGASLAYKCRLNNSGAQKNDRRAHH
jgi:hypothetical protein